jgi:hypothetical protein
MTVNIEGLNNWLRQLQAREAEVDLAYAGSLPHGEILTDEIPNSAEFKWLENRGWVIVNDGNTWAAVIPFRV